MSAFESGVSRYLTGSATVVAHFPVDSRGKADVCCDQCRFLFGRRCSLTGEVSNYPGKYIGEFCPLDFEEGEA